MPFRSAGRQSGSRSRRRRPSPSRFERAVVVASCLGASAGALAAGPEPTGNLVGDVVATVGFSVVVVLAASIASSWAWVTGAGLVAVFADDDQLLVAGVLLVLVIAATTFEAAQRRAAGAVVGAAIVQLALRLPEHGFLGANALVVTAAVVPLLVSAWGLARSDTRRWALRVAGVVGGVVVVGTATLALAAVAARTHVQRGVDRAEAGLAAARRGDTEAAAELLASAERSFAAASSTAGAWWTAPARLVPVVAQQAEALDRGVRVGRDVADAGAESAGSADLESVRMVRGRVDLDAVAALAGPLRRLDDVLRAAQADLAPEESPWLTAPLANRLQRLRAEIDRAAADADLAAAGVDALPVLLGQERPARYVVLFGTAAESRHFGGFVGAYAEVVFTDGSMSVERHGIIDDLNAAGAGRVLTDPDALPVSFRRRNLERFWQNIASSPDLPTIAEATRQLWPQSGGGALDGVMYVDPAGVAGLLELTGPVAVEGATRPLEAATVETVLLRDIYTLFPDGDARDRFVDAALAAVLDALGERSLPGPEGLGEALGEPALGGHLAVHTFADGPAAFLRRLGINGQFAAPDGGDFLSLRWDNTAPNKIDPYLRRAVSYDVVYDPASGAVRAVARIELENTAPPDGLPPVVLGNDAGRPDGTNVMLLAWYSPLLLDRAVIGDAPAAVATTEEYGRFMHSLAVTVPPGATVVVELALSGDIEPGSTYRLTVSEPAAATEAPVAITVSGAEGWRPLRGAGEPTPSGARTLTFVPDAADVIRVEFALDG